ncbi:PAS domain S-box protein, partial [Thiolapillus sp.]
MNNHFLDITGWERDDVIGKNWIKKFVVDEDQEQVSGIIRKM